MISGAKKLKSQFNKGHFKKDKEFQKNNNKRQKPRKSFNNNKKSKKSISRQFKPSRGTFKPTDNVQRLYLKAEELYYQKVTNFIHIGKNRSKILSCKEERMKL